MTSNNAIIYKAHREQGEALEDNGKIIRFEKRSFDLNSVQLEEGDFVTENLFVSLDPYLIGKMNAKGTPYAPPNVIGEPIDNGGVGKVVKSKNNKFPEGAIVGGMLQLSEYTHVKSKNARGFIVIENKYNLPLSHYTGILGMPGMTAYVGLEEIGKLKKGETIFVSTASGAVGQLVGQLAKQAGAYVVGSAGTEEKVAYLKDTLKFDAAFNYKTEKISEALDKHCPKGIDVYWDNVGGETLDAVLLKANLHSRIIGCGMISGYNNTGEQYGVKNLMNIVGKRINFQGFIVFDHYPKYHQEFLNKTEKAVSEGAFVYKEDIYDLENATEGLVGLYSGKNFGKALVRIHGQK
eukprot:TRINITY_DN1646_c0_g1_i1.p1 TRINITY_DN1646_c0_g1~~TRINITY_DN1646_c0_g1_i1.p1  ORF type:complete len:350 (+),score=79.67 TRINITY_DN1646_c0_g1_i1:116-1165(+)